MWKYAIFIAAALVVGCSEPKCTCDCPSCGVECRNRCESDRCIIGEACCEECLCPQRKPIKLR